MNNENTQDTNQKINNDLATSVYANDNTLEINLDEINTQEINNEKLSNILEDDSTSTISQNETLIENNSNDVINDEIPVNTIDKDIALGDTIEQDLAMETVPEIELTKLPEIEELEVEEEPIEPENITEVEKPEEDMFETMGENTEKISETVDNPVIVESNNEESQNDLSILFDEKETPKRKTENDKKLKLWQKFLVLFISVLVVLSSGFAFILYGPYPNFREWLITTAMTTMNHQYLATWFYSDKTIDEILKKNYVLETGEEVDTSQVKFVDYSAINVMYKNKYEKEILTKDEGNDLYKLININESGMRGYLVVIYDPSKVKIATATNMNSYGEMLTDMVKKNNAVIGMNASGFYDPNYNGNGGKPYGIVIKNGKVVSNLEKPNVGGGIIGFTNDNKLILGKMTAEQALQKGVRDAVEFGPYLIVNGKPSFIKGNGGWGTAPRSAIAQRQDGIVLFLVMDGRDYSHGIDGVGMVELTEILMQYGAYNASNLDGGTSSGLVIEDKLINKPVNGSGQKKTRKIPDGWIVVK